MSAKYSLKDDGSFVITDYQRVHPFSNFLPGISGVWGIPLWVFYVNRGQGVISFGLKDKDHSIAEFFPANKAYQLASSLGFRTFIKSGKAHYEPFSTDGQSCRRQDMIITSYGFLIKEEHPQIGLRVSVRYFTLPNLPVAALARVVSFENISGKILNLEILDGLSKIIPFGSINPLLKDMSRTLEAWMHSNVKSNLATFKLIVEPGDISHTRYIEGANFNYAFYEENNRKVFPSLIVDPAVVFGQDTAYSNPETFIKGKLKSISGQMTCGKTPSAFSYFKLNLAPHKAQDFYSIFGASFKEAAIRKHITSLDAESIKAKEIENRKIIEKLKNNALCVSGLNNFDHYVKNTYLDNVLRGGYPYKVEPVKGYPRNANGKSSYYVFSRKHGDLERDYNHFNLRPSYFSEGEGNYRDVNQNRRMDLFFEPSLGYRNILYFLNFLKIDGYNPLVVTGEKLYLSKAQAENILKEFGIKNSKVLHLMVKGFYLGDFFNLLAEEAIEPDSKQELAASLLTKAQRRPQSYHAEGYWIDHWRYNLDLIENFLYIYPDKLKDVFLDNNFMFWDDEHRVKPRALRYVLRAKAVYQGESIEAVKEKKLSIKKRDKLANFLRAKGGKIYKTNLIVKLLAVILNKAATLDPHGIGIEMEADKPGWCDSLNGLPALFGSSLCETFELKRACLLLQSVIKELKKKNKERLDCPGNIFIL